MLSIGVAIRLAAICLAPAAAVAQVASDAIIRGTVLDESRAAMEGVRVEVRSAGGAVRDTYTRSDGTFSVPRLAPGRYTVAATHPGFQDFERAVSAGAGAAVEVPIQLRVQAQREAITVQAEAAMVQNEPVASQSVDLGTLAVLPTLSPGSGLNDAIVLSAPGVAADSNGFFHPLGDHAQVSYVIDGQPIGDQRNKVFSTSIPLNAIQSMDIVSGSPSAEFGDKTSLVVETTTKSGLNQPSQGSLTAHYGSFGTIGEEFTHAIGNLKIGNYLVLNAERTGRFLDTPEFRPMHAIGNTGTIFDRADFHPDLKNAFHLNLLGARNWLQIPNTYDQPEQDQRQKVVSFNIAPGYERVINSRAVLTANVFLRRDRVDYYPSRDPFHDLPATAGQDRSLTNAGFRLSVSVARGRHSFKSGVQAMRTRLKEQFALGITDPLYNAPCLNAAGDPETARGAGDPAGCAARGLSPNPDFLPALLPYDLSRGGASFRFAGRANIDQAAWFAQDTAKIGNLTVSAGLRVDWYRGLTTGTGVQPRVAASYLFAPTGTVIRIGYSRTMETPVNENLVVSSSTGAGGLAGSLYGGAAKQEAIPLGRRNQYDAGIQQPLGRLAAVTVDYFRKYTHNAFDFDTLFSTPITFPIGWAKSKLDGVSARIATSEIRGFRAYATMGHANARFFGPEVGGVVFNANLAVGAYRQDHDQVYQQTVNVTYRAPKGRWSSDFTWRYDSGLVVGAVNSMEDALGLTAAEQSAIGLYCGAERASLTHRIVTCESQTYGAERIHILAPGTANPDRNPPRTTSRHVLDASLGSDRLFVRDRYRAILRFSILNLTNQAALYNFLSPFSGTHWVVPRTYQVQLGFAF